MSIAQRFEYDHAGRLLRTFHQVDDADEVQLTELAYNELGQLVKKSLHVVGDEEPLQAIDYRYTIQGQLLSINADAPAADEPMDYFNETLVYADATDAGNTPRYDGLLSGINWISDGQGETKEYYNYTYDGLKRMTDASYQSNDNDTGFTNTDAYSENNITYDLNGNILTLDRYTQDTTDAILKIDQLSYAYDTLSNQLLRVTDNAGTTMDSLGLYDGNTSGDDYAYDANGNLIKDLNKGIATIRYNILNRPAQVTFSNGLYITYRYDAAGSKLEEQYYSEHDSLLLNSGYLGARWRHQPLRRLTTKKRRRQRPQSVPQLPVLRPQLCLSIRWLRPRQRSRRRRRHRRSPRGINGRAGGYRSRVCIRLPLQRK